MKSLKEADEFGDFVTHRIEAKAAMPKVEPVAAKSSSAIDDLFGFDNLKLVIFL